MSVLQNHAFHSGKPLKGYKTLPFTTGSFCIATKPCLSLREAFVGVQNLAFNYGKLL
jgi:hypothetical protein